MTDDRISSDEPRVDLSPLDPMRDVTSFEAAVARVMERAAPVLARYAGGRTSVIELFAEWTRPLLVAAAIVGVIAAGALVRFDGDAGSTVRATATVSAASTATLDASMAEAIGVPATMAMYVGGRATPGPSQLLYTRTEE